MSPPPLDQLGRRERQIMDILFRLRRASATQVQDEIGEPLSNSAVRGMLRYLAQKGYVTIRQDGPRYVYSPAHRPSDASKSALRQLLSTFFQDSPASAIAALLDLKKAPITDEEYERLSALLERARKAGGTADAER